MDSSNRTNKIKKNIIALLTLRGVSMFVSFLYVPMLYSTMGTEEYAIWLTLTSIVSWIVLFDIGIGNGLRNKLAASIASNNHIDAKEYVSTAYVSIFIIGFIVMAVFLILFPFINWKSVLNAESISPEIVKILVAIVALGFIIHFQAGIINSILLAMQLPAVSSLIVCSGQILSFIAVLILVKVFGLTNLLVLSAIISFIPPIVLIIASLIIFKYVFPNLSPRIKLFTRDKVRDIFNLGLKFFWLQIITISLFQTNNLLIMHVVSADAVVKYNIAFKYYYILVTINTLICTPIWSAATEAYTKNEIGWIENIAKKLERIAFFFLIAGVVMTIFATPIYNLWIGRNCPEIPFSTNLLLLIYSVFMIFYGAYGYIINGIGCLKLQLIVTTVIAMLYVPLAMVFGKNFGLDGVLAVFAINSMINALWSKIQLSRLLSGAGTGIWVK